MNLEAISRGVTIVCGIFVLFGLIFNRSGQYFPSGVTPLVAGFLFLSLIITLGGWRRLKAGQKGAAMPCLLFTVAAALNFAVAIKLFSL